MIERTTAGTPASEVWSLAATLYTFAAGRSPFSRESGTKDTRKAMSARIVRAAYTPVPGAQGYEAFDGVMAAAMTKQPERRFASMQQFGEALQQLQRLYGYDVTPLDVVRQEWMPQTAPAAGCGDRWSPACGPRGVRVGVLISNGIAQRLPAPVVRAGSAARCCGRC